MKELKPRIHENGMDYVLVGDYYVPDLKLPEEHRPIGHWGRLHQSYLKQFRPMVYSDLLLSGKLHTVLADLNEQATDRLNLMIRQMAEAEGVTEAMKAENQMLWVQSMNSIRSRAEEIIKAELIYWSAIIKVESPLARKDDKMRKKGRIRHGKTVHSRGTRTGVEAGGGDRRSSSGPASGNQGRHAVWLAGPGTEACRCPGACRRRTE